MNGQIASEIIRKVGRRVIADRLGIARESTYTWERSGIPATRVLEVEQLSGYSRHVIRPDIFGPKPSGESDAPVSGLVAEATTTKRGAA